MNTFISDFEENSKDLNHRLTKDIESLSTCFAGTLISCYPDSDSSWSLLVNETATGTSTVNDAPFDRHVNLIWTWWVEQD